MKTLATAALGLSLLAAPAISAERTGNTSGAGAGAAGTQNTITQRECDQQRIQGATIDPRCRTLESNRRGTAPDRSRTYDLRRSGPSSDTPDTTGGSGNSPGAGSTGAPGASGGTGGGSGGASGSGGAGGGSGG